MGIPRKLKICSNVEALFLSYNKIIGDMVQFLNRGNLFLVNLSYLAADD